MNIPSDILRLIVEKAAELCTDAQERIQLQNDLMRVDRTFCRLIVESPFVSMVDALHCRNPLAASVALRYLAMQKNAFKRLLDIPQIVGAARIIRRGNYALYNDPYLVYMFKLGNIIKYRLTSTFYDDLSVRSENAIENYIDNDDFTKLA